MVTLPTKRQEHPDHVPHTPSSGRWRKLLGHPLLWALVFLGTALPWYLDGRGLDFLPFILTLLGGWFCGHAFVRLTFNMASTRRGFWVHAVGAIALGAAMVWSIPSGNDWLAPLPVQGKYVATLVQMAAIPGVAWVWLALISRLSDLARKPPAKAQLRTAPPWEETANGTSVSFPALPMTLRMLGWIIAGVVVVVGALLVIFLITFDWIVESGSARLMILVAGTVFALPAYYVLKTGIGRKTVQCTATFGADQLRITIEGRQTLLPYRDINSLLWRATSDYARLEVVSNSQRLTLIAGFARVSKTALPELPKLSHRTRKRLIGAGLTEKHSRRPDVVILDRASVPVKTNGS